LENLHLLKYRLQEDSESDDDEDDDDEDEDSEDEEITYVNILYPTKFGQIRVEPFSPEFVKGWSQTMFNSLKNMLKYRMRHPQSNLGLVSSKRDLKTKRSLTTKTKKTRTTKKKRSQRRKRRERAKDSPERR